MGSMLLCAAVAAWSLGSGALGGEARRMEVRAGLAPAGYLPSTESGQAGLWAGSLLRPVVYRASPVERASTLAATPGLCGEGRFGVNGRPVSDAFGSRSYRRADRCGRFNEEEGGVHAW